LFTHVTFKEVLSCQSIECNELVLDKTVFLQSADFLDAVIKDGTRETFRSIKSEFLKSNNAVESQVYQAKELRVYERNINFRTHTKEKIVLWSNKVSNDFGTNWVRGVYFTFICAFGCYCLYILTLAKWPVKFGWEGWESFVKAMDIFGKYFFKFMIVTHDMEFMSFARPNTISFLFDFLGRILIGYGIVQTIIAFRKYGK
jgi:hypothetical protein